MSDHHVPQPKRYVLSDDPIRKFQGRMVSFNGIQLPFAVRHVSWLLFLVVCPLVVAGDWLLTGTVSAIPLVDLTIAALLTNRIANITTGETNLLHVGVYAARKLRAVAAARRTTQPTTSSDRVRARRRHPMINRKDRGNR